MLMDWHEVIRVAPPMRGIIHIGAHRAEERSLYLSVGIRQIIWIEADPRLAAWLEKHCDEPVFCTAIYNENHGQRDFHLANNDGMSSSLLWPKEHIWKHPGVGFGESIQVSTITLDTLIKEQGIDIGDYNTIVMDIQGAELLALHGMTRTLPHMDVVYTEVNFISMYEGCGLVDEVDEFLSDYGFRRILTHSTGLGWGDALYCRREIPVI